MAAPCCRRRRNWPLLLLIHVNLLPYLSSQFSNFSLEYPIFLDILRKICIIKIMSFERFRRHTEIEVFDYPQIAEYLKHLKKQRDKVSSLVAEGKIVRIKNGLYIFGEEWRHGPLCLEMLANLLYGPSCLSFEFTLGYYGLIAERSRVITSLAIGDSKVFQTPVGLFEYRAISPEKFKVGIDYRSLGEIGGYFIASKEKALADLVYRTPGIRTLDQLHHYLFEEMRVDESMFRELDFKKMSEIAAAYNKNSVYMINKL